MRPSPQKRAVILAAVPIPPELRRYVQAGDTVVACDAGWHNAQALGLTPDLLVGDFDSMPAPRTAVPVITLPAVKDDTDAHYAARWLLQHGYTDITLLGALGGTRLEHTLANIATGLFLARHGVRVVLADAASELRYLLPDRPLTLPAGRWGYFSLFPLDGPLTGVDITGGKYPLQNAVLTPDFPLGVSNEFAAPAATLRCTSGCGLVVLTRGG